MVEYLSYFVDLIKRLNFKIKVLCLDRGFYSTGVPPANPKFRTLNIQHQMR